MTNTDQLIDSLCTQVPRVIPAAPPAKLALVWTFGALTMSVALLVGIWGTRPDLVAVWFEPRIYLTLISLILVLLSTSYLAFSLAVPGKRISWWYWAPSFFVLLFNAVITFNFIPPTATAADGLPIVGLGCSRVLILLSLFPGFLFFYMLSRLAPIHAGLVAEYWGAAMGAAGAFGLSLYCPSDHFVHLLVYHSVPIFVLGAIARFALVRLFRW